MRRADLELRRAVTGRRDGNRLAAIAAIVERVNDRRRVATRNLDCRGNGFD